LNFSTRAHHHIPKLVRSIADLSDIEKINNQHIAEAIIRRRYLINCQLHAHNSFIKIVEIIDLGFKEEPNYSKYLKMSIFISYRLLAELRYGNFS